MSDTPGRNDPCHCGSGRKYKNCCYDKDNSGVTSSMGMVAITVAIILALLIAGITLSGGDDQQDCPDGTVWSESHQHCH